MAAILSRAVAHIQALDVPLPLSASYVKPLFEVMDSWTPEPSATIGGQSQKGSRVERCITEVALLYVWSDVPKATTRSAVNPRQSLTKRSLSARPKLAPIYSQQELTDRGENIYSNNLKTVYNQGAKLMGQGDVAKSLPPTQLDLRSSFAMSTIRPI